MLANTPILEMSASSVVETKNSWLDCPEQTLNNLSLATTETLSEFQMNGQALEWYGDFPAQI